MPSQRVSPPRSTRVPLRNTLPTNTQEQKEQLLQRSFCHSNSRDCSPIPSLHHHLHHSPHLYFIRQRHTISEPQWSPPRTEHIAPRKPALPNCEQDTEERKIVGGEDAFQEKHEEQLKHPSRPQTTRRDNLPCDSRWNGAPTMVAEAAPNAEERHHAKQRQQSSLENAR